ncbi:MAG: autotransporter outer membrane beta-barrel domain-containing protein [Caulobacter sp.]|nr:autotransporter outer membrane beta-barrel domain-containing protein [Caulobacter sp.]
MIRHRLLAGVAATPLLLCALPALAETTISTERTTPVKTSTVNAGAADDLLIDEDGSIVLETAGPAVTVDSDNTVTNEGGIEIEAVDGAVGIQVNGGVTTTVSNEGSITLEDGFDQDDEDNDTDDDGDYDGAFATGTGRYGIRVSGPGTVTGDIASSGSITVEGNDSYGVSLESALTGNLVVGGSTSVLGDNAVGVNVAAVVSGRVETGGSISVRGVDAVGLDIAAEVGALHLQGAISATGYRYTSRASDEDALAALDADDLLPGGSAVRITANIAGGVLLEAGPATDTDFDGDGLIDSLDDDDDGDAILDDDDLDQDNDGITDDDYDNDGKDNGDDDDDDNDGIDDDDDEDDNGDGILDTDLDQDGRPDSTEGTAALSSYGSAPALLIGSDSQALTMGRIGVGDEAYGLINRGSIYAAGVYDGVEATALRIGGDAGFATLIEGGVLQDGSISAYSYAADAQAVHLAAGAAVETFINNGSITVGETNASAAKADEAAFDAIGLRIDARASLTSFANTGSLYAYVSGETSNATALLDASGTLTSLTNSGTIAAYVTATDDENDTDDDNEDADDEEVTGRAVALNLTANTTGVSILQFALSDDRDGDGVVDAIDVDDDGDGTLDTEDDDRDNDTIVDSEDDEDGYDTDGDGLVDGQEPLIIGDILLGSGEDTLAILNGGVVGDISFGAGADSLTVGSADSAAEIIGALRDADGQLDIALVRGELTVTNAETIAATSLSVGADGVLTVTADPDAGSVTRFEVASATLAEGAQLGLQLDSLIGEAERYTIIQTAAGGLDAAGLDATLEGDSPYVYVVSASADETAGAVYLDVRRRTTDEIGGLTASEVLAFDAVYAALEGDEDIEDAFLGAETREDFLHLYQQMLPDQGEGLFSTLDLLSRTTARLTANRPTIGGAAYGPDSVWIQEINTAVVRSAGNTAGSETKAFGFIAGYESLEADGGALGATLAFVAAEERDDIAQVGEETSVSLLEAGVYWRQQMGGLSFNLRGSAGYAWLDGDRVFIDPDTALVVNADSEWGGWTGAASASVNYEARLGRFYLRPSASLDYISFSEAERVEGGGSDAFDQVVQARRSSRLSAGGEIAIGATFGREVWWRPEVRLGYRQTLAGEVGDTVFRFTGGQWVTLPASEAGEGAAVVGFSLKTGSPTSYVAVEGEYEAAEGEDRYNLMLAGRVIF